MYRGIIFDFDGVLATTMEDNFAAWRETLKRFRYDIDREEFFLIEGTKLLELAALYKKRAGIMGVADSEILKQKEAYYLAHHSSKFYPGAIDFLAKLKSHKIPTGLVTAATYRRIVSSTPKDFLSGFSVVVTAETGGRGKPYPDPYKFAIEQLKLLANECIVVENAPLGIEAAKRAGAYCVAVCSTLAKDKLTEADEVVPSFKKLADSKVVRRLILEAGAP